MLTKVAGTLHREAPLPEFYEYGIFVTYRSDAVAEIAVGSSTSDTSGIDHSTDSNSSVAGVCAA